MNSVRTVIIAKAPHPGFAKTRLAPALGADGTAALARRLLRHTVQAALDAAIGPVELCVTPSVDDPCWESLALPPQLEWSAQGDGDLGARMARAAARCIDAGQPVLLIGTDCPGLDAAFLREAGAALQAHNAVIIPAFDGGYVLLGLKRMHASLFAGIAWSTPVVAQATLARLAKLDWSVRCAAPLHDIDEPADLRWLPAHWQDPLALSMPNMN